MTHEEKLERHNRQWRNMMIHKETILKLMRLRSIITLTHGHKVSDALVSPAIERVVNQ